MSASTGPILAAGAVSLFNDVIVNGKTIQEDTGVIVGTAIAAGGLALLEKVSQPLAVGLAWLVFVSVFLVRQNPKTLAPIENFAAWYKSTTV